LPDNVSTNRSVVVKATVKNIGEVEGTFRGTVRAGPVSRDIPILTLGEGAEREVSVKLTSSELQQILGDRDEATQTVELGNRTATLYLRKPRPATASYLSINVPSKAYVGDTLTIGILVKNVGDLEGSVGLEATVGGERISQSMTLKPGQEKEWQISRELTGVGSLEVSAPGLEPRRVDVGSRPPVWVRSIKVPKMAVVGEEVEVEIDVGGTGSGTIEAVGPTGKHTLDVTAGQKKIWKFTPTTKGVYTIGVEDKSSILRVVYPTESNFLWLDEDRDGVADMGNVALYETDYKYEILLGGTSIYSQTKPPYKSLTIYRGFEEYEGITCMKYQTADATNRQAYTEYYYSEIEQEGTKWYNKQVAQVHVEPGQETYTRFDPPAKNWSWPLPSEGFTGEWVNYRMDILTTYGGSQYRLEVSGQARFVVRILGEELYRTKWGEDVKVKKVEVTTEIKSGSTIKVIGMTGTIGEGSKLVLTRLIGPGGSLKESAESRINFTVMGMSGSMYIRYTSDMLAYQDYWERTDTNQLGRKGDSSYFNYLPSGNVVTA
ncbi:MAG: hypothetical protein QXG14_04950, partial [Candidatus Hadarchaeales archaeon]